MAKAYSKVITTDTQDVLSGTVVGILGNDSPSYDVEIRVAAFNPSNPSTAANVAGVTLLVNGVAVMQNSRSFTTNPGGNAEPRSDSPLATFNAAAGSRLTLNLDLAANTNASVYVEARESSSPPQPLSLTHVGRTQITANNTVQDVLRGTVVGQVPADANAYELSLMLSTDSAAQNGTDATLLVDTDTVCEGFTIPHRTETLENGNTTDPTLPTVFETNVFGNTERDTVLTSLVTAGSEITLNLRNNTSSASNVIYAINIDPVA